MYLCIDIGGTKTIVALVNLAGEVLHYVKFPTIQDQKKYYNILLQQIRVNFCISSIKAISVAMPGIIKHNEAAWLPNLDWHDFNLCSMLKTEFGTPVYLGNDANLAALAEAHGLKGRSLYFTFSTGVGGGVVEDGQIPKRYADFEPGHIQYVFDGKAQEWEDLAAASVIKKKYHKLVEEIDDQAAWDDIINRMLLGLVPLTTSIKPARIFFGGPLGLALNQYRAKLRKAFRAALPSNIALPRLIVAKYGSLSVIHGCYLNAKAHEKSHR